MEAITKIHGTCLPLAIKNIDTDMIIPAQYMTSISQSGYGKHLFDRLRKQAQNFPYNQERYQGASIIVARDNFGCGSSREHAVWALMDAGFKAVISTSFADIFQTNAGKNGLLTIELKEETVEKLISSADAGPIQLEINLVEQFVMLDNTRLESFEYDPFRKYCLTNGLDDMEYLLKEKQQIDAHFSSRSDELVNLNS